jgi:hypothetical protein
MTESRVGFQKAGIVALMALGSVAIWIGSPIFWMWLTSKLQEGRTQASLGPYVLLLAGIIATSIVLAKCLSALNRLYGRVDGGEPTIALHMAWMRMRGGEHERDLRRTSVLDVVMVVSVMVAGTAFLIWYFVTDPTPPNVGGPGPAKH